MTTQDVWDDGRRLRLRNLLIDVLGAGVLTLLTGVLQTGQGKWALAAMVVLGAMIVVRRLSVPVAIALAVLGAVIQLGSGQLVAIADLAYAPLYFTLGADPREWVRRVGLIGVPGAVALAGIGSGLVNLGGYSAGRYGYQAVTFLALAMSAGVVCGGGWTAGYLRRQNRQAVQSRIDARLEAAERLRLAQELDQQQHRARIAADMHDVVAHSWAVVAAQSDGARYAMRTSPLQAERALEVIGETARSAMADVRTILTELRDNTRVSDVPSARSQDELIARMRASGLDLQVTEKGQHYTSPLLSLTAYRVLSESLTNALKHGDVSQPVRVEQIWGAQGYFLTVVNAVVPGAPPGEGTRHGIIGMTERVSVAGGQLHVFLEGAEHRLVTTIPVRNRSRE